MDNNSLHKADFDPTEYADLLFGVGSATSAGPSLPCGSIHPSPETLEKDCGGYLRDQPIIGFGNAYTSGSGGVKCYGKIYREGGYILLVGVAHNKNTYLHCVDEMLGIPNRLSAEPRTVTVKLSSGEVITKLARTHKTDFTSDISTRFPKYETAFRYHGAIRDGFVGSAPTQLCDARIMKEVVELIVKNSDGADPLAEERAMPPKWYC